MKAVSNLWQVGGEYKNAVRIGECFLPTSKKDKCRFVANYNKQFNNIQTVRKEKRDIYVHRT